MQIWRTLHMKPAMMPVDVKNLTLSDREFQPVWNAFQRNDLAGAKKLYDTMKHKRVPKKTALYFTVGYVKLKLGIT